VNWISKDRPDGGKPEKIPIDPRTGKRAATNRPTTWGPFDRAWKVYSEDPERYAGVGFVFSQGDPYAGLDLDGVRDPATGKIEPWAAAAVKQLGSYAEVSPSSTGVKAFARGSLPVPGRRKNGIEMYDSGHFFAATGRRLPGTAKDVMHRQNQLYDLFDLFFAVKQSPSPVHLKDPSDAPACRMDDDEVIRRATKASERFARLWDGDVIGYRSPSEADWALSKMLCFWVGRDPPRIDALFRRSGLLRPKWDEGRGARTYGGLTIRKAMEAQTRLYQGRRDRYTVPAQCVSSLPALATADLNSNRMGPGQAVSATVEHVIKDFLPTRDEAEMPGAVERKVSRLARALKSLPHLHDAEAADLMPLVSRWYDLAGEAVQVPRTEVQALFTRWWASVIYPNGCGPIEAALAEADSSPVPAIAAGLGKRLRRLASLVVVLQRYAGSSPVYLGCRTVGRLLGAHHTNAAKWLRRLRAAGLLELVEEGRLRTGKASEYRVVASAAKAA
jgi:hypothetical protein